MSLDTGVSVYLNKITDKDLKYNLSKAFEEMQKNYEKSLEKSNARISAIEKKFADLERAARSRI